MVLRLMDQAYVLEDSYSIKEAVDVRKLRHQIEVVLDKGYYNATLTDVDLRQLVGR
jgi:hypothetical protein